MKGSNVKMIVRSWHGIVSNAKAASFEAHLIRTGVNGAKTTPGNLGAFIHHQSQREYTHFFMVSYWNGWEAVRDFAGPEPHIAVEYPGDADFGLISDPVVLHHEVGEAPEHFPLIFNPAI
jgi:heme-degrading monooxygenase HmoA